MLHWHIERKLMSNLTLITEREAATGTDLANELRTKYACLKEILRAIGRAVVAYSGGVDSTLVAKVALDTLGSENVLAVLAVSPSLGKEEFRQALNLLSEIGIPYLTVETAEVDDPAYAANPINRCYFCKQHVYSALLEVARARGFETIVDGFNADDRGDYRPGRKAGRELGVRSPLAEAELGKDAIRALARYLKLNNWSKSSMACLSSRVEYGTIITPQILDRIDRAELALRKLGFDDLRVRHHDKLARIEVDEDAIERALACRDQIINAVKAAGYVYVTLDLQGLRHGSMNEGLKHG